MSQLLSSTGHLSARCLPPQLACGCVVGSGCLWFGRRAGGQVRRQAGRQASGQAGGHEGKALFYTDSSTMHARTSIAGLTTAPEQPSMRPAHLEMLSSAGLAGVTGTEGSPFSGWVCSRSRSNSHERNSSLGDELEHHPGGRAAKQRLLPGAPHQAASQAWTLASSVARPTGVPQCLRSRLHTSGAGSAGWCGQQSDSSGRCKLEQGTRGCKPGKLRSRVGSYLRRQVCTAAAAAWARIRSPTTADIRSASRCSQSQLGMALAAASSSAAAACMCTATSCATSAMSCAV